MKDALRNHGPVKQGKQRSVALDERIMLQQQGQGSLLSIFRPQSKMIYTRGAFTGLLKQVFSGA
jgi:hypothetical protein